jgi:hypothetical protein
VPEDKFHRVALVAIEARFTMFARSAFCVGEMSLFVSGASISKTTCTNVTLFVPMKISPRRAGIEKNCVVLSLNRCGKSRKRNYCNPLQNFGGSFDKGFLLRFRSPAA